MGKEYTKPITMSWQAYVDQQLVGTGSCTSGAILGPDGSTWATSAGFAVSAAEGQKLASQFTNPGSAQADGVNVAGTRYMCLRADDRSIYGKKGAGGACCVKTNMGILVGVYSEGIQPGACNAVVEKLADYLIEMVIKHFNCGARSGI